MKKIGILTFHKSYNYGAFMQCYALVERLKIDFPNIKVEVIDYTTNAVMDYYSSNYNSLLANIREPFLKKKIEKRNKCFVESHNYLPLSDYSIKSDDFNILFDDIKGDYDAIIVGSDAVWNWIVRGFPNAYFLNANLGAKKLSYAASSHGMDYTNTTSVQCEYLKKAWNDFSYIGVRDNVTDSFVKSIDNKLSPIHNCDPTIFLDLDLIPVNMEELKNKISKAGIDINRPIIGIMGSNWLGKAIRRIFKNEYQIVAVYEPNRYADAYLYNLTPFEWAKLFSLFSITFTHFFHGTLLSLKNLTPTIPIEASNFYSRKFNTKIKDVMKRLDLLECYFTEDILAEKGWSLIKEKAEEIMDNPSKEKMQANLYKEAENYNSFKQALEDILGSE